MKFEFVYNVEKIKEGIDSFVKTFLKLELERVKEKMTMLTRVPK
jgi:FtsZ-binding cell division protein ZapB